ncbi:hypothetical protein [Sediminicurvatus halobius]|uniref:Antitoxin n=1 Tax=Sediminicurvatus halobius TaxID=2182432 RepID=A0A2U2MXS2_9GAMM|nr:hypothetical protein [Spiribacter halobius]PWG61825.1 hypothetical protein DEM34_14545 [Spiribacter halobius]UEX77666.1 hypothetical protein LMH63_17315 [Spiribacter halobius]
MNQVDEDVIQSYDEKVRWSRLLDRVAQDHRYVLGKHDRVVAALVPMEECGALTARDADDSSEPRELAAMVERLQAEKEATTAALDSAFAEIGHTRERLSALRAQREHEVGR